MKKQLPHEGHRERLKNRFLSDGLKGFEKHNILELLLFYSIPRQDTNEIAHDLLDKFGSLKGVFDADFNELIKVKGIKENSATLIKLIPQLAQAYISEDCDDEEMIFDHADKIGSFLTKKYIGETKEVVYLMILDNKFRLIKLVKLAEGSVNSSRIEPRNVAEIVFAYNASSIIIAHNHPNGLPFPSQEDIETTSIFTTIFPSIGINLLEHFIITEKGYCPIMHDSKLFFTDDELRLKYY